MLSSLQSALGIAVLVGIAWALSERRRDIRWRAIGFGLLLQLFLALLLTQVLLARKLAPGFLGTLTCGLLTALFAVGSVLLAVYFVEHGVRTGVWLPF